MGLAFVGLMPVRQNERGGHWVPGLGRWGAALRGGVFGRGRSLAQAARRGDRQGFRRATSAVC